MEEIEENRGPDRGPVWRRNVLDALARVDGQAMSTQDLANVIVEATGLAHSTVRRWIGRDLRLLVASGEIVEVEAPRSGRPGRPARCYRLASASLDAPSSGG